MGILSFLRGQRQASDLAPVDTLSLFPPYEEPSQIVRKVKLITGFWVGSGAVYGCLRGGVVANTVGIGACGFAVTWVLLGSTELLRKYIEPVDVVPVTKVPLSSACLSGATVGGIVHFLVTRKQPHLFHAFPVFVGVGVAYSCLVNKVGASLVRRLDHIYLTGLRERNVPVSDVPAAYRPQYITRYQPSKPAPPPLLGDGLLQMLRQQNFVRRITQEERRAKGMPFLGIHDHSPQKPVIVRNAVAYDDDKLLSASNLPPLPPPAKNSWWKLW
eukprot:RCo009004